MLTLQNLTLKNFGPFKGTQRIEFSNDPGVTIIFGENGRGKTTVLNSLRFALFGTIKARTAQEITFLDTINIEAKQENDFSSEVSLTFQYESNNYELKRSILKRTGISVPISDADLVQEFWLRKNGDVLAPDAAKIELAKIMPEQVSRFFLFDGELLQEYEELLRQESSMGEQIKEAIERILGVPILTNARQDLQLIYTQAQRQETKAATHDQKTQELQAYLRAAIDTRDQHEKIVSDKRDEKHRLEASRASVVIEMRKTERLRKLLEERDRLASEITKIESKISERKMKLQESLNGSWKSMLIKRLVDRKSVLIAEYNFLLKTKASQQEYRFLLNLLESSLISNNCLACNRSIDDHTRDGIKLKITELGVSAQAGISEERLNELLRSLSTIENVIAANRLDFIRELAKNLEDDRINLNDKKGRFEELKDLTIAADEKKIQRLTNEDRQLTAEIALIDQAIQAEQNALVETKNRIERIETELSRVGGIDLAKERRQRELCSKLHQLFIEGISLYREQLRVKVENAATTIFKKLTNDPDYVALQINNNYGLSIVHRSGQTVKVRSAGNEHIVALSLMGALQQNAPLKGPIIMDSPFGRLDLTHKANVVKTLPTMAEQTVLLIYESEIDPKTARNLLEGKLRNEYRIHRISSFNSVIKSEMGR